MTDKPLISIITTTYNMDKYLEECIQSVLVQDYPYTEHIIQDAKSTDHTYKILKKYKKAKYKNKIKIFREPDKGQSDGLNKALQKTSGDILLVLNADDALLPHACSWAIANMKKYPKVGVVYGDQYIMNDKSEIIGLHIYDEYDLEKLICVELVPPAQAAFIRRTALEKVGFWIDKNLDTCPDFELWLRITRKFPMKHIYGAITKYRADTGTRLDSKQSRTIERFIIAKRLVMDRLFNNPNTPEKIKKLPFRAYAGLNLWASRHAFGLNQTNLGMYYLCRSFLYKPSKSTFLRILYKMRIFFNYLILEISRLIGIYRSVYKLQIKIKQFIKQIIHRLALILRISFENIPIQKVQNFWDQHPCNINHSLSKKNTKKYFDEVEKRKYFVEPHIPKFADFPRWKGKKVLEIGCGIGTDTINFARAGAKVTAVEISKKSLDIAKRRANVYSLENKIKFYLGNAEELSQFVPLESYDLIYSFGVIHHTPLPHKIMQEIKKYLHDDTIIKIMVYYRYSWKVLWMLLKYGKGAFWKLGEIISKFSEAAIGSPVSYTYTKRTAKELLRGFKIIKMEVDHIFPYSIREYRQHKYKKVWYLRYFPKVVFRWLEKRIGWHLLITAIKKNETLVIPY